MWIWAVLSLGSIYAGAGTSLQGLPSENEWMPYIHAKTHTWSMKLSIQYQIVPKLQTTFNEKLGLRY